MNVRGIRGATTVRGNTRGAILGGTRGLLRAMMKSNRVGPADVAAAFFTLTPDLNAGFPASISRELARARDGRAWTHVPVMCSVEIGVPDAPAKIVRVMLLVNTDAPPGRIRHQFLGGTRRLRPDLPAGGGTRR